MTFDEWLKGRYQPSTVRKTLGELRSARANGLEFERHAQTLRRYTGYLQEAGSADGFDDEVLALGLSAPRPARPAGQRGRKLPAESFADDDWRALCQALAEDHTPEGCVLHVACQWPRRIGEVLSLTAPQLDQGLERGRIRLRQKGGSELLAPVAGAHEALGKLGRVMHVNRHRGTVSRFVSPDGRGSAMAGDDAYQRCNRYLKRLGDELGVVGRVHLHRIRRTVAVQALRLTSDVNLVRDLLGHRSVQSTFQYVDEVRLGDVEVLQRKLEAFR